MEQTGAKLTRLRGDRTQQTVSDATGISVDALPAYEKGERIPREEAKRRLAKFHGMKVEALFPDTGTPPQMMLDRINQSIQDTLSAAQDAPPAAQEELEKCASLLWKAHVRLERALHMTGGNTAAQTENA